MITLISSGEACPTFGHANATFLDQIVGLTCYCLLVIGGGGADCRGGGLPANCAFFLLFCKR